MQGHRVASSPFVFHDWDCRDSAGVGGMKDKEGPITADTFHSPLIRRVTRLTEHIVGESEWLLMESS